MASSGVYNSSGCVRCVSILNCSHLFDYHYAQNYAAIICQRLPPSESKWGSDKQVFNDNKTAGGVGSLLNNPTYVAIDQIMFHLQKGQD